MSSILICVKHWKGFPGGKNNPHRSKLSRRSIHLIPVCLSVYLSARLSVRHVRQPVLVTKTTLLARTHTFTAVEDAVCKPRVSGIVLKTDSWCWIQKRSELLAGPAALTCNKASPVSVFSSPASGFRCRSSTGAAGIYDWSGNHTSNLTPWDCSGSLPPWCAQQARKAAFPAQMTQLG